MGRSLRCRASLSRAILRRFATAAQGAAALDNEPPESSATALDCRNAAVVLAGFGGAARECAVGALTALLEDPWSPDHELVEAATGLVEIGIEFHERCAEVFHTILRHRTTLGAGLQDAAVGLASLGPHRLVAAVTALTTLTTDRRVDRLVRIKAADVLAELGPQHRIAAGELLMAMSSEFDMERHERWRLADSLARVGLRHRALDLLRAVLTDRAASPNNHLWAARSLADLGPDHQEEAAHTLRRVADHSMATGYDRATAWGQLAAFGEPHRTPAVTCLRGVLADRGADPEFRCEVAVELTKLGPCGGAE